MKTINFDHQIQTAQLRLQAMQELADGSSPPSQVLQNEAIAEFSITLEELHVATEELQMQNEELLASRQRVELEHQRYQELFDFAPDGYLVTNEQGVIQQVNHAATHMLNLRQDLSVGKPLIVFIDKADQISFHIQLEQLVQLGHPVTDWEISLKPREKTPFPVSISVSTIYYDPHGKLTGFRWLMRDLSQRKQNEQKISEQANLLNIATDAIFVRDLEGQILFWNQGAERLYGWTAAEAIGKKVYEMLYWDSLPQMEEIQNNLILKAGEWRGELNQVVKSHQDVLVESRWTLVRDREGKPTSILIVNTDITEKKQLESQLFQCQRVESLGTLSTGIAHDLNNILTPILGIAQLLPRILTEADQQTARLMYLLEASTKRAIELVNQVQLFAGGSKGKQTILHVSALISTIEELAEKIFPKSIDFHSNCAPDLWCVVGDAGQLNQILMNLCINARDAMPDGGTLSICAKNLAIDKDNIQMSPEARIGPYVVITVLDTGIGMTAEMTSRIFEPFFTTKDKSQGSGLGLSIVSGILKNHHGFALVSSRINRGSQFQVFLPALKTIATTPEESLSLPRGNGKLILVVDDEVTILETTKPMLEGFGYQVITAQDGIEAIALYRQNQDKISVVLMDMMMPSMDGEATILGLQSINPQVKIIASSGLPLNHQSTVNVDANVKALLPKPYSLEMLLTTLYEVIPRSSIEH